MAPIESNQADRTPVAAPPVSGREVELLQAILAEPSLADAAHSLGYSARQGRRLMAELRDSLGVDTNLQAMAVAVALGYVEPELDV